MNSVSWLFCTGLIERLGCKHHLHSIQINNFSTQCNERFHLKHTKHSYTRAEPRVVLYPPQGGDTIRFRSQDRSGLTGLIGADRRRPRNEHPYYSWFLSLFIRRSTNIFDSTPIPPSNDGLSEFSSSCRSTLSTRGYRCCSSAGRSTTCISTQYETATKVSDCPCWTKLIARVNW
jgi:hypothetical protein